MFAFGLQLLNYAGSLQTVHCKKHILHATLFHAECQWNCSLVSLLSLSSCSWTAFRPTLGISGVTLHWQVCKLDQNLACAVPLQSYLKAELRSTGENVHISAKTVSLLNLGLHVCTFSSWAVTDTIIWCWTNARVSHVHWALVHIFCLLWCVQLWKYWLLLSPICL